jgi:hypothetical protein
VDVISVVLGGKSFSYAKNFRRQSPFACEYFISASCCIELLFVAVSSVYKAAISMEI